MLFESVSENEWYEVAAVLPHPWPEMACYIDLRILRRSSWHAKPHTLRDLGARWGVSKSTAARYVERSGVR